MPGQGKEDAAAKASAKGTKKGGLPVCRVFGILALLAVASLLLYVALDDDNGGGSSGGASSRKSERMTLMNYPQLRGHDLFWDLDKRLDNQIFISLSDDDWYEKPWTDLYVP